MTHHHPKRRGHMITEGQFAAFMLWTILVLVAICGLVIKVNRQPPIERPQARIIVEAPKQASPAQENSAEEITPKPSEDKALPGDSAEEEIAPQLRGSIDLPEEVHHDPDPADVAADADATAGHPDGGEADRDRVHRGFHHSRHRPRASGVDLDVPVFPGWMKLNTFN